MSKKDERIEDLLYEIHQNEWKAFLYNLLGYIEDEIELAKKEIRQFEKEERVTKSKGKRK